MTNENNSSNDGVQDAKALARNLDATIEAMMSRFDFDEPEGGNAGGGMGMGMNPEDMVGMLRPMLSQYTRNNPEVMRRNLAIIHLETGALLQEHTDEETDAVDLV